jgi:hypothetical protein
MASKIKRNVYNNSFTKYKGHIYDSKSEAMYAYTLDKMVEEGKIKSVERQVKFPLPNLEGKLRMAYIADFVVIGNSGIRYVIDVKGFLDPQMKVKLAYAQTYHNMKVHIVFNKGVDAFRTDFLI